MTRRITRWPLYIRQRHEVGDDLGHRVTPLYGALLDSKAATIRKILESGDRIDAIRLSGGYSDEADAYRAEAMCIDLVNALLASAGRPALTNATPGHHAGFLPLRDHFRFVAAEVGYVPDQPSAGENTAAGTSTQVIVVKGSTAALDAGGHRLIGSESLHAALAPVAGSVRQLVDNPTKPRFTRRGWDPQDPWNDTEARERAARYWPFASERVAFWLAGSEDRPTELLLGIPSSAGTAIRYAWEIDYSKEWDYFPELKRWGVPLGRRLHEHPRLGTVLREDRGGKDVQVLQGYAAGVRTLQI